MSIFTVCLPLSLVTVASSMLDVSHMTDCEFDIYIPIRTLKALT
jgi:hypothetical protein